VRRYESSPAEETLDGWSPGPSRDVKPAIDGMQHQRGNRRFDVILTHFRDNPVSVTHMEHNVHDTVDVHMSIIPGHRAQVEDFYLSH
jgi:hypothetical protein